MSSEYIKFEGILFPKGYSIKHLKFCRDEFVVKNTDVIVVTYPKSGTNWVIEIISLIHSKGDTTWVQSIPIFERSPWVEVKASQPLLCKKEQNGPRFYSSHLPIWLFPKSYFQSKAKIIYVMRNPKDVIVSLYHFTKVLKSCPKPSSDFLSPCLAGIAGDWKNHFTVAQSEAFDKLFQERMAELDQRLFPWEQH
uniref:Sulfotransferase n=1 Tax=Vombatus ursinus TaxID=29139 RepID=A0A4X2LTM1_VOMUR